MRVIIAFVLLVLATLNVRAEILIGVAGPLSGTYSAFGTQMVQGVQAAVDQLNAQGGVEGELVEIVSVDDGCDNRRAELAAQTLVEKSVSVVIGHYCTYPSLAAAKVYEAAGIPMIAPSASLPALTESGLTNVIRLAARDDAQGKYAGLRMKVDFAADKIAVVSDGSPAAAALVAQFVAALGIMPASFVIKPDEQSHSDLIAALTAKNISALYCACAAPDAGVIAAEIAAAGLVIHLYGPDALLALPFWEKAGAAGEGTLVSFALDPQASAEARKVAKQFNEAGQNADGATLPAYTAVQIFAAAAEKMGFKNGRGISTYLHSGTSFSTAIGSLSFDAKGDVREPRLVWYVWSKGKFATEYSPNG